MSKLPTALLTSRRDGAAIVVALVLIASILTLTIDSPAEAAPGWSHETLDAGVSTGEGLSTIYWPPYLQHHVFNSGIESSERVLRHGWYQPGFSNWAFETLDQGNSTGMASATGLWDIQHHVFNTGDESGSPVLRHGWYQPGFSNWAFETLDVGVSTGTDTAYAEYSGQQHVFTHGLSPTGEDILRHGYYDPGIGSWVFETLDIDGSWGVGNSVVVRAGQLHFFTLLAGSVQGLRHGWYEPGAGWKFETLASGTPAGELTTMATPLMRTSSLADSDINLWYPEIGYFVDEPFVGPKNPRFIASEGKWTFPWMAGGPGARPDGRGHSATAYRGYRQFFDYATPGMNKGCSGIFHAFWDWGLNTWITSIYPAPCKPLESSPIKRPTATTPYPPFDQLHVVYAQDPPAIGHYWYNPT